MTLRPNTPRIFSRVLAFLAATCFLSAPALATWSVVVINKITGEVACASATCIGGKFPLKRWLPVIVVGKGAAAAQSAVDISGQNRLLIWDSMHAGMTPADILQALASSDAGHQSRQYGIVSFDGPPVTFTGTGAGMGKFGVVGETDELLYAIQGNVITGDPVVLMAEQALINTPGDLGQKVMAAMEAARAMGGDGRCSCSQADPDGCGSPPPNFTKSAHTAFFVMARLGDKDGVCDPTDGCASGAYYLSLVFKGKDSDPDPIFQLQAKYDAWRADLFDKADHVLSRVNLDRSALVADGLSSAVVRVQLRDVDDLPLSAGGHKFELRWTGEGAPTATPGPVTDLGGGVYSFPMTATFDPGRGAWRVRVKRPGDKWVQLARPLVLTTDPVAELHAGRSTVTPQQSVPFTLNLGPAEAGRGYMLLGSASGSTPGVSFGNVVIPLNRDRYFEWTWGVPGDDFFGSAGSLDVDGRGQALLMPGGLGWAPLVGSELRFSALLAGPPYAVTNVVSVRVLP
jgi:uncharacterized Ntn-hydrolase superfamily protein